MFLGKQVTAERRIIALHIRPQVEAAIRTLYIQHGGQDLQHRVELLPIQRTVGPHMDFVVPGRDAGQLGLHRHRAAVVGAIQQEGLENIRVTGNKTRTQPRQVGALGQAVEHHATLEVLATQRHAGAEQARRRGLFVEVQLAVALVGGDHEVVLVGQGDQFLQGFQRDQRPGRIARRAQEQDLATLPDLHRHGVEVRVEAILVQARQVVRLGPGEEGRAFVDLIEGVGADHQRVVATIDHGLGEGEQRLTGAIDRQDIARRVDPAARHAKTPLAPAGDGFTQGRYAEGGRVHGHLFQVGGQGFGDKRRRAVLRFADGQGDRSLVRVRRHAAEQGAEFLERVGLQLVQGVVHR